MLVLEGADKLGKTTAAKKLVEMSRAWDMPTWYGHMGRPGPGFNFFTHYHDMISMYGVQDRFHLGGLVWHHNEINIHRLRYIESWLGAVGSYTVVFVTLEEDWLREQVNDNDNDMFDPDTILKANESYWDIVNGAHPLRPHYDKEFIVGPDSYITDDYLTEILEEWITRIKICPNYL
jgi:hypothetical protein